MTERCTACAAPAVVRMKGVALCARCGLERSFSPDGKLRRTRRALVFGIFSSGLLTKMAVGAVAVAAIGSAALAMPATEAELSTSIPTATTQYVETTLVAPAGTIVAVESPPPDDVVQQAQSYAASVESWGECVSEAARAHAGEAFDPSDFCDTMPAAADHGLLNPAGHERGQSTAAPGHQTTDDTTPGQSTAAPGHHTTDDTTPGQSTAAPGHQTTDDTTPGQSDQAPGHQDR